MKLDAIMVLSPGETPWQHGEVGVLEGPWEGETTGDILAALVEQTGYDVLESWDRTNGPHRGNGVWVILSTTR